MITKREIVVAILKDKKLEVEIHRANHVYPEWSCGQQDADAEEAERWDRLMSDALCIFEDNNVYYNMTHQHQIEVNLFVMNIIGQFMAEVDSHLLNY